MSEYADIEDIGGNVIGKLNLSTMRVVAPNRRVDNAVEAGEPIYINKDGIRSILTPEKKKRKNKFPR